MLLASLAFVGCGGDSSSNQSGGDGAGGGGTSKVALFLADGPTDAFDQIWIEVSAISLLPEGDGAPVVIYETDDPQRIDLLTLREDDLLLAVNSSVPAGEYHKIRLTVESVEGQQADQPVELQLSSGKIDLNPRGAIDVKPGETLSLRLDIDAEKSIHTAGSRYNFRPVVFVESGPLDDPRPCHHLIKGKITQLLYSDQDKETVTGFQMAPFGARAVLDVYLEEDVVIFDDAGLLTDPNGLAVEQMVYIKGKLDTDARFLAGTVIIGEVRTLSGVVQSAVDDQNQFLVDPGFYGDDPMVRGNVMAEDDITTVALSDGTIIRLDGDSVDADRIQPGLQARIVGKMGGDTNIMNAIAVFLKAQKMVGILTEIEAAEGGGSLLTIRAAMRRPHDNKPNEDPDKDPAEDPDKDPAEDPDKDPAEDPDKDPAEDPDKDPAEDQDKDPAEDPDEDRAAERAVEACFVEEEVTVFLPDSASLSVKGGSELTLEQLTALVACEAPRVELQIDGSSKSDGPVQADALEVWPHSFKWIVASVDPENRTITAFSGATLQVPENTPIWLSTDDQQETVELGDIEANDLLHVVALKSCEPTDYSAVQIIKMPDCEPPEDPCWPRHKRIEFTVAELGDNTITGDNEASIAVTDETVYVDMTQRPPQEMGFNDIAVGDTLVCHILNDCDDQSERALMVYKIDPEGDGTKPAPDECTPKIYRMKAVVETVADGAVQTAGGRTIQVPSGTPIYEKTESGLETITLDTLEPGDTLEIKATQTCREDGDGLTALMIIRHAG
jgi:hypothetical protein